VGQQVMADLPSEHTAAHQPPLSHIGVDFFGPFVAKQCRSSVKCYGCIFSCLTIRAVHIDVTQSSSTDSFLDAFRRFISSRGKPLSDNAGCFVGADRILRESIAAWNQVATNEQFRQKGIQWVFNPPLASHFGGCYERMIRSIRKILNVLLREQLLSHEKLNTFLVEVESILNSWPLVPICMDSTSEAPLTPNHLLRLRNSLNVSPGIFSQDDNYARKRWRHIQYLTDQFWVRWIREYLPTLQERSKWLGKQRNFNEGDVVLLVDKTAPRAQWLVGRILQTFPDEKGCVRIVSVRTKNDVVKRLIAQLCLVTASSDN